MSASPQVSRDKTGSTPAIPRGRFVWYELLASDEAIAKLFYTKVMGWTTETWPTPPGSPPYSMFNNGTRPFAGLMALPDAAKQMGAPSHWMGYITTPDTDASAAQAKQLGATIHMAPFDIPEVGRAAVIADPTGASFALFTPRMQGGGMPEASGVGNVSWNELTTDDQAKAFDFYSQLFGWEKGEAMDMGPMGVYQILVQQGEQKPFGAMYPRPPQIPVCNWLYYHQVANLDDIVEKVKTNGGKVLNGPMDVPGGRIAQCMDPQGAVFAAHWIK